MKKILKDNNGGIFGVFNEVKQVANGYICDGASYQTIVTGEVTVEEVADDYTIPQPEVITPIKPALTSEYLQKQLEDEIKIRGLNFIPGEGKHPISDWPGESSFLIFDLSLESSKTLGRKFNQNAIVWCDQDAIPQLILLR
jgi:hypothetical protein